MKTQNSKLKILGLGTWNLEFPDEVGQGRLI